MPNYFDAWHDLSLACECGWRGTGADTTLGECFEQLYERDCPQCYAHLLVISFPTEEEIRMAAARGVPEAISELERIERRNERG